MKIQNYITILEEHKRDLEISKGELYTLGTFLDILEALDFAIDSLKAVDESLVINDMISRTELLDYIDSKLEYRSNTTREEVLRQVRVAVKNMGVVKEATDE